MKKLEEIGFSKRERECFLYLLKGFTYKEIGKALGLSDRTIEAYLKNMRMKVGASSRKDLTEKVSKLIGWDMKDDLTLDLLESKISKQESD